MHLRGTLGLIRKGFGQVIGIASLAKGSILNTWGVHISEFRNS